jgi:hypothetical protein
MASRLNIANSNFAKLMRENNFLEKNLASDGLALTSTIA